MNKTEFERLLDVRSEKIYQENKMILLKLISDFFNANPAMNAHEQGWSVFYDIDNLVNGKIEDRKQEIIRKIKQSEMNRILLSLESVSFLFKETP